MSRHPQLLFESFVCITTHLWLLLFNVPQTEPCVDDDCGDVGTCYSLSALVPLITVDDDDMLTGATYTGWDKDMVCHCSSHTCTPGKLD